MVSRQTTYIVLIFLELLFTGSLLIWILVFKTKNSADNSIVGVISLVILVILFLNSFTNLAVGKKGSLFEKDHEWFSISRFVLGFFATFSLVVLAFILLIGFGAELFSPARTVDSNTEILLIVLFCLTILTAIVLFNQYSFSRFQKRKLDEQKTQLINSIGVPEHE